MINNRLLNIIMSFVVFLSISMVALNTALYGHYHITETGFVIWHAHPFKDSGTNLPVKDHHHNKAELLNLQMISNLLLTALIVAFVFILFALSGKIEIKHITNKISFSKYFYSHLLRAPPVN